MNRNIPSKVFIGGEWVASISKKTYEICNPANQKHVATLPFCDGDDCRLAIESAHKSMKSWSKVSTYERAEVLRRSAEEIRSRSREIGEVMVLESGKPIKEAIGEVGVAADLFAWYAEEVKRSYGRSIPSRRAGRKLQVEYHAIGVVGVITAWNFPAYNPARAWAAALAAGCGVVAKPSEETPLTALMMAEIFEKNGLPKGVLNVIFGDAESIGKALLENVLCRKISFTGSTQVGQKLIEGSAKNIKKLSLELGGNAPVIICDDVDVEMVARTSVVAKFRNAGQVCVAPQRFYVQRKIADAFKSFVKDEIEKIKVGEGSHADTMMGPIINKRQLKRVQELVEKSVKDGAALVSGGRLMDNDTNGNYYQPTLLFSEDDNSTAFQQEVFGPVYCLTVFDSIDEAIEKANKTEYGLAAYVWGNDAYSLDKISGELEFGMVAINDWIPHATEAPFIGIKQSGLGHESGQEGLYEYMEPKLISTVERLK